MTDSRTRLFGLIGNSVTHSLSPAMHSYFTKKFKINGVYCAFQVEEGNLAASLTGARALGFAGLNVTTPHKESVVGIANFHSPDVSLLRVANTLSFRQDGVYAYVTDHLGFLQSLAEEVDRFKGAQVLMFGAGGSARSIAFALSQLNIAGLTIVNRDQARAAALVQLCRQKFSLTQTQALPLNLPQIDHYVELASILINTTSIGMFPMLQESPLQRFDGINKRHYVFDVIYNPIQTRLLFEADKRGATVKNGMEMLIFQGLASLNIWLHGDYRLDRSDLQELKNLLYRELE